MQRENKLTVGQWCDYWFTANRRKWNGNTEGGYRNLIYSHILPSIGSVALSDLTEQTITDFYDTLRSQRLSARSVWCVHLLLRRCMDEAAREQFIPYNPVRLCQESKAEEYKAAPLRLGYVRQLEEKGLIYTEPTMVRSKDGRPLNGNLLYTIRPISGVLEAFYERQFRQAEEAAARYRAAELLKKSNAQGRQNALCAPFREEESPSPNQGVEAGCEPFSEGFERTKEKAG